MTAFYNNRGVTRPPITQTISPEGRIYKYCYIGATVETAAVTVCPHVGANATHIQM
jgi:hypothetical protein